MSTKKILYSLEYPFRCSAPILFEFLTTESGLQEWFADKVEVRDTMYTFSWKGSSQEAELIDIEDDEYARFRWLDEDEEEFFEFRIEVNEITNSTSLTIYDFAYKNDIKDQTKLWDYQIEDLKHRLGN
jgi:uncharacterized protein YndB with AHSA1/START domain